MELKRIYWFPILSEFYLMAKTSGYLDLYSYHRVMTLGERPAGVLCINPWHQSGSSPNIVLFSRHIAGRTMQLPLYTDQMRIQFDLFAVGKFVFCCPQNSIHLYFIFFFSYSIQVLFWLALFLTCSSACIFHCFFVWQWDQSG